MDDFKIFFLKCSVLFPLLAMIICVNYWQDPAHLFHSASEERIARLLIEKKNVANVKNFNDRIVQKAYINRLTVPNNVIALGSSRILQLRHENFCSESFFNHGVAYGSLPDILAIYYNYYQKGLLPAEVILGVDPWFFNRNNNRIEWQIYKDDYDAMRAVMSKGGLKEKSGNAYVFKKISSLFSPSYFQESLKGIKFGRSEQAQIEATEELDPPNGMLRWDGQVVFPKSVREVSVEVVTQNVKDITKKPLYALGNFKELDDQFKNEFELFIDFLLQQNTKVIILLSPYHQTMWNHMTSSEYKQIEGVMNYVVELAKRKGIVVKGSYDPEVNHVYDEDFYDERHPKSTAFDKIFGVC